MIFNERFIDNLIKFAKMVVVNAVAVSIATAGYGNSAWGIDEWGR